MSTLAVAALLLFNPSVRADGVVDMVPPWPRSDIPVPSGAENPCAAIRLRYYERVEPQGFLGVLTPDAEWQTVRDAVDDNLSVAWKGHRMRNSPLNGEGAVDSEALRLGIDHHIRPRSPLELLAFEFRLFEVCREARRRGIRSLTFACDVDSIEYDSDEPDHADRNPGSSGFPILRRPEREPLAHGYALTRCFLSTARATQPTWEQLLAARWGDDARSEEFAGDGRHELVKMRDFRRNQYFGLIRQVVNRLVTTFRSGAPVGPRAESTAVETPPVAAPERAPSRFTGRRGI